MDMNIKTVLFLLLLALALGLLYYKFGTQGGESCLKVAEPVGVPDVKEAAPVKEAPEPVGI
jgi:hypothetical protein